MKSFLVAKTVQTTSQWRVWWEPSSSVSLWKQPRFLSVWNSLDVNLSDRQGVDFQAYEVISALQHWNIPKKHKIHIHKPNGINQEQSHKVSQPEHKWHSGRAIQQMQDRLTSPQPTPLGWIISPLERRKTCVSRSYEDKWNIGRAPTKDLLSVRPH